MTSIPEPNAILASLRERGHADLPDVDIRIGASVLADAITDSSSLAGTPVILSDGGPYRTPAGSVVDRLAEQLGDCPVIQLGTGMVRADEETVERAVAGVGSGVFASFEAASIAVQLDSSTIDPDPEAERRYADAYGRYRDAFDAVESALAT